MSAIEMSIFKLNGYSADDFIKANEEIEIFLKRQPGFRSRAIAEQEDGTIIDLLIWDSVNAGTTSAELSMVELKESPVHSMIDQKSLTWIVAPIRHQLD